MEFSDAHSDGQNIFNILVELREEIQKLTEVFNKLIEKGITTKSDNPFK